MERCQRLVVITVFILGMLSSEAMAQDSLRAGSKAPGFVLPAATRDTILSSGIKLEDALSSSPVVLAFYPADWSGGCTKEMCTMRDNFKDLGSLGATVFGISGDYVFAHHQWARDLGLPFMLLSDHTHAVAKSYQSYNDKTGFNRRTVFVIDRSGTIRYVDRAYDPNTLESFHRLQEALATVKGLSLKDHH